MSRDEALVAVLNAARALKAAVPEAGYDADGYMRVPWHRVLALFAAVDAVDAVGEMPAGIVACAVCEGRGFVRSPEDDRAALACLTCGGRGVTAPDAPYGHQEGQSAALGANRGSDQSTSRPEGRTERFCSVWDCWRTADLPSGTCYHHSPAVALPSTRVMRAPVFEGGEAE